jgi:hypothetical protein
MNNKLASARKTGCFWQSATGRMNQLLEILVMYYVLSTTHQNEADVMAAVIARRKLLAVNAGHLMLLRVVVVVNNLVNSRTLNLLSRREFFSRLRIGHWGLASQADYNPAKGLTRDVRRIQNFGRSGSKALCLM